MPRCAWLLFTPDMANELHAYVTHRELWVVDDALPDDVRCVGRKAARGGAEYLLCESASFADVSPADYPLLPTPRLRKREEWLREMAARARRGPAVQI
jgi:hypothetical protein